ncbi:MAG: imidazoleglycerol-phosphate dehydratase HisB [Chthonomonadales bacterium]
MPEQEGERQGACHRKTNETDVHVELILDGGGDGTIRTGVGFLDHMLTHVSKHGRINLAVSAAGDLHVDEHHTVEDVGIALGQALDEALADRSGIERYGWAVVPMDEALVLCSIDISGRGMCVYDADVTAERVGSMATEMVPEFFRAVAMHARMTVHIRKLSGSNAHHVVEAAFKAFGRALAAAAARRPGTSGIPSTKGVL